MAGPLPMTSRIARKLRGRHGWNRSTWKRHQNRRECVRRLVQLARRQLSGSFISPQAQERANDLRLRAIGLQPAGGSVSIKRI